MALTTKELILKTLKEKSALKLDVYNNTKTVFAELKAVLEETAAELKADASRIDERIKVEFQNKGEFDCTFKIASDLLIFQMHSNVFEFEKNHHIWKTSYVKDNEWKSFCGVINVYNFLADSFKYNRENDIGYLVARIFINKEMHFFVEGNKQLGFLYTDFINSVINKESLKSIVESVILYSLTFDLLTPPYETVQQVSLYEVDELSQNMQVQTGKRLGYKFKADEDSPKG